MNLVSIVDVEYVVRDGDTMFSICSYVAETYEAINLVEGERVYIIGKFNFHNLHLNYGIFSS